MSRKDAAAFSSFWHGSYSRATFIGGQHYFGQYEHHNPGSAQLPVELWWRSISPDKTFWKSMAHHHQDFLGMWDLCWHSWHAWQGELLKASGVTADTHETITTETAKLLSGVSEVDDEDSLTDMWQDMRKGTISHVFWIYILKCLQLGNCSSYRLELWCDDSHIILLHSQGIPYHAHFWFGRGEHASRSC